MKVHDGHVTVQPMDETPVPAAIGSPRHTAGRLLVTVFLAILFAISSVFIALLIRKDFNVEPGEFDLGTHSHPLLMAFFLVLLVPLAIIIGWADFSRALRVPTQGLLAGLLFGLWSLSCAIGVPYLGIYPSVWAATIHWMIFGLKSHGLSFWATLYVLNLVVCPVVGMLFFQRMARWRQLLNLLSHQNP